MNLAKFLFQQRNSQAKSTANVNATSNEAPSLKEATADQTSTQGNIIDHVFSIAISTENHTITEPVPFVSLTNKAIPIRVNSSKELIPVDVTVNSSLYVTTETTETLIIATNASSSDTLAEIIPNATAENKGTAPPAPRYHTRRYTASTSATVIQVNKSENDRPVAGPSKQASTTANKKGITQSRVTRQSETAFKPLGPRHLEYDFHVANVEFKAMAYEELAKIGYPGHIRPSRKGKERAVPWKPTADQLAIWKNSSAYKKAAQKLNDADRALDEALEAGNTWDNTEVPLEYTWANEELKNYIDSLDKNTNPANNEEDVLSANKNTATEEEQIDESSGNTTLSKIRRRSKKVLNVRKKTTKTGMRKKKQTAMTTKSITNSAKRSALNEKVGMRKQKQKPIPKPPSIRNNRSQERHTICLPKRKRKEEIVPEDENESEKVVKLTITIPATRKRRCLKKSKS